MTIFCNSQQAVDHPHDAEASFQLNGVPYFGLSAKEIRCCVLRGRGARSAALPSARARDPLPDVYIGLPLLISKAVGNPVGVCQWIALGRAAWSGLLARPAMYGRESRCRCERAT